MILCLIVYNFTQDKARQYLREDGDYLPNQSGKPVQSSTSQWIFAIMVSIAVVEIRQYQKMQWIITKVHTSHQKIISYFGVNAKRIYDALLTLHPGDLKLN